MFPKRRAWILALAVTTIAVVAGLAYRQHHRYKHLAVHDPGMVYRSAWLEPDVLREVIEKYQIRTVVNLCQPGELGEDRWRRERQVVQNAGARLLELPMPVTVDPVDPAIAKHVEMLGNPDNYPLLVHCQHGVTRTAKLLAIYDIVYRNMSAAQSLAAQPLFGRDDHNVNVRAFAKRFEKSYRNLYPQASADDLHVLRR